jgi:hypothetical protein
MTDFERFRANFVKRFGEREGIERIFQFKNSAFNFLRHGAPTTPPEALATREATCKACPEWDATALNNTGRCRKCGCSTWAKLRMATERCPIGKWEAVDKATN